MKSVGSAGTPPEELVNRIAALQNLLGEVTPRVVRLEQWREECQATGGLKAILSAKGSAGLDAAPSPEPTFVKLSIHKLIEHGDLQVIKLKVTAEPECVGELDAHGRNPLIAEVCKLSPSEEIVNFLLLSKADAKVKDRYHITALHYACRNGNLANYKIIQMLLSLGGADAMSTDDAGRTPLHMLARQQINENDKAEVAEYTKAVDSLLAANARINDKDKRGDTPLHIVRVSKLSMTEKFFQRRQHLAVSVRSFPSCSAEELT